ncbi:MAG: winged helix-turn-helix domain-containing protein [candidate division Zixibacteria bacterium]|nr:winged helix-turn-helix domain-containing protein [candidate division Zixibacteria bacterium]
MKDRIGETAGKVWQALQEHGNLDVPRLAKQVGEKEGMIHMAVGWLAREDKIDFHVKGPKVTLGAKG